MANWSSTAPLTFCHLASLEVGPPDLIDMMAESGFASTTLRMRQTAPGSPAYPLTDAAIRRATKERIAATGVSINYTEVVALSRSLDLQEIETIFEAAADVGVTRVVTAGDDEDFSIVTEKLAQVCELARRFGMIVELEFMPFRAVKSLSDAMQVLKAADQPNAQVMIDALHFRRSNSSIEELRALDPKVVGSFQLCDAPAQAPADIMYEARNARLLTGKGGLNVDEMMDATPTDVLLAVEVPLALEFPNLSALERAKLTVIETRKFLERRAQRQTA